MLTFAFILALLAAQAALPGMAEYTVGLLAPRKRGSTTELGLDSIPPETPIWEFFPEGPAAQPGCRYFNLLAPWLWGRLGAISVAEAIEMGWEIKERVGAHGPELYRDVPPSEAEMPLTSLITFVVGPEQGHEVVFTWHPGLPLPPQGAVKVHNG